MDCEECIRRERRLNVARLYLEFVEKKFEQDPKEAEFPLEQAEAYLAEVMNSHQEHPLIHVAIFNLRSLEQSKNKIKKLLTGQI
jgi:hypothetical protein